MIMAMSPLGSRRFMSEINVTPLVDVMLVLLIIFMVTAPLLKEGVRVDLPEAKAKPIKQAKEQDIIITIDKNGKIYIGKTEIDWETLKPKMKLILRQRAKKEVYLQADKSVPYGVVIKALAALQDAGAERIGMITEPPRPKRGR